MMSCRTLRRHRREILFSPGRGPQWFGSASLMSEPALIVTSPTIISTKEVPVTAAASASCFFRKALRQLNNCGGEIPRRRASGETFSPSSSAAVTAFALNSSDHWQRSATGAPSKRSITTLTNWKLQVAGMGVKLVVDMQPRRQSNATSLSRTGLTANPGGLIASYSPSTPACGTSA